MHERAGQPARPDDLVDLAALESAYYDTTPDPDDPAQQVVFGTSGHRGSSLDGAFNEAHILAITQAICEYRAGQGYRGPLLLARDTHALSLPAWHTALEVLVANDVTTSGRRAGRLHADAGVVARDPAAQPRRRPRRRRRHRRHPVAQPAPRRRVQVQPAARRAGRQRRHRLDRRPRQRAAARGRRRDPPRELRPDPRRLRGLRLPRPLRRRPAHRCSTSTPIREAGVRIGADPMGGASVAYWGAIAERHRLDLTVVNDRVDPQWGFMTLDHDGKIRMDCSSPYAMASLVERRRRLRPLDRQRRRRRPARHRHPRRRADEPEPLPRRGHRLPAGGRSWPGPGGDRQDAGVVER